MRLCRFGANARVKASESTGGSSDVGEGCSGIERCLHWSR
ncbi:MAG: hypothetical protein RUDDFDWM_000366 [Candidatus Fervidibacterota bacterium]